MIALSKSTYVDSVPEIRCDVPTNNQVQNPMPNIKKQKATLVSIFCSVVQHFKVDRGANERRFAF